MGHNFERDPQSGQMVCNCSECCQHMAMNQMQKNAINALYVKVKPAFDEETFYNLMQTYRTTPVYEQQKVIEAYEAVKKYLKEVYGG